MNLVEEATRTLKRTEGINRQQEEVYLQMTSQMNQLIQSMEDERYRFASLAELASEAGNLNLSDQFQQIAYLMNQELEAMDELRSATRRITNQ